MVIVLVIVSNSEILEKIKNPIKVNLSELKKILFYTTISGRWKGGFLNWKHTEPKQHR